VPQSQLAKHIASCPERVQLSKQVSHACFVKACNAGPGPDLDLPSAPPELANAKGSVDAISVKRLALAVRRGPAAFEDLLRRIATASEAALPPGSEPLSVITPPETEQYLASGASAANKQFSIKHGMQQASIAGNMRRLGLIRPREEGVTYIELGAGRGYLALALAECFGLDKVAVVDVRGFRMKADRAMRHLELHRLRCDLADFEPRGVPGLDAGAAWVGVGKHLCGAATDFALRCVVRDAARARVDREGAEVGVVDAGQSCTANEDVVGRGAENVVRQRGVLGVAVATCCHHRCSWRHFAGREEMEAAGFDGEDFELISWMTGA
jgi:tRNA:m4X modification enzyme